MFLRTGIIFLFLVVSNAYAINKSICDNEDNRRPSKDPKIGRVLKSYTTNKGGCTATLIGKSCMISAGHCRSALKIVEFDPPMSVDGDIVHPYEKDIYEIRETSIRYANNLSIGDWAVFQVRKNKITGLFPGETRGHYQLQNSLPNPASTFRITGFGRDDEPDKYCTQQTHTGNFVHSESYYLEYRVDTTRGSSGAPIINDANQKIVGVHTDGGCSGEITSVNAGTTVLQKDFRKAIMKCLETE